MTDEDKLRFELGEGFKKLTNNEYDVIKRWLYACNVRVHEFCWNV